MTHGTKEQKAAYRKRRKLLHPEKVKAEKKAYKKRHPEKAQDTAKRWLQRIRRDILSHYSHGTMICANCGESHLGFLEIDHINGGGKQHRREINGNLFKWLKDNNYPEGYQVLCSDCNHRRVVAEAKLRRDVGTPEQKKSYRKNFNLRLGVFNHYLIDGKVKCSCCGNSDIDILCIHSDIDLTPFRSEMGSRQGKFLQWLKRNNYPPGFRILCHNCNQSLGTRGCCPHHPPQQASQVEPAMPSCAGPEPAS